MANEVNLTVNMNYSSGGDTESFNETETFDQAGTVIDGGSQDVGTSWEQLDVKTDFGTPGLLCIVNRDDTNFVQIGNWNSGSQIQFGKLLPGVPVCIPLDIAKGDIALKADTAACRVTFKLLSAAD